MGCRMKFLQLQMTISPSNPKRIYAEIAPVHGPVWLYRSDDGGDHWVHAPEDDTRPEERIGGGDVPVPLVDPKDPDTVYVASIVSWKSTDAGKTWTALRGSPGGDDYQNVWVNPNNTKIIALASDQGVVISQNGGAELGGVVQPGDGADVSRDGGQCVSVSGVRRAAGFRVGVRAEPQQ